MCGIAGIARTSGRAVELATLARMAAALRHRGPDGYGFYAAPGVGFAHVRLAVIDAAGGAQPMASDDGRFVITFNGEIYNYRELVAELAGRGHRFRTRSDTEVLLRAWQEWGPAMFERLLGMFAFALHDRSRGEVVLARDRFAKRPLYYAAHGGDLYFASEAKALFATREVPASIDPAGLDQVFWHWGTRPPQTPFAGVRQLERGTWASWRDGALTTHRYHELGFPPRGQPGSGTVEELGALFQDAVTLRLRSDVPVGGFLSGGLDSSLVCAEAARQSPFLLRTFSITFADPSLDERRFQEAVARAIGSRHVVQAIDGREVADALPRVVWHAESPMVRTAPVPMYLLSRLVRREGIRVVLSGEGADELFLGYDLFREAELRRACLRQPDSPRRPLLFDRLYPWLGGGARGGDFWRRSFLESGNPADPLFSHMVRFGLTSRIRDFYAASARDAVAAVDQLALLREGLPPSFEAWDSLHQAAWLEMETLLVPYLLSAQGDRMCMAHGIEARLPFLDHRLAAFAAALPPRAKLRGMTEKAILRDWARGRVPPEVLARPKQPYRAPDVPPFVGPDAPEWVHDILSPDAIARTALFDPTSVAGLLRRCRSGRPVGVRESQAFVAVLTTQLWHRIFLEARPDDGELPLDGADVMLRDPSTRGAAAGVTT